MNAARPILFLFLILFLPNSTASTRIIQALSLTPPFMGVLGRPIEQGTVFNGFLGKIGLGLF